VAEIVAQNSDLGSRAIVNALGCHVDVRPKHDDTLTHPWMWWQLLTYGFVHQPDTIMHILFNMLAFYFLGKDVEEWYGTREFLRFYLVSIVFSGFVWAVTTRIVDGVSGPAIGASGGVTAVIVLYALLFPRRQLLFMFLPMPAWLVGALVIAFDILGTFGRPVNLMAGDFQHVAYVAHLGGAAFAFAYFYFRWNLGEIFRPVTAWM
jgi:membrane associated rhomboid family serine protease